MLAGIFVMIMMVASIGNIMGIFDFFKSKKQPELMASDFLQSLIKSGNYPFHFEFVMEADPDWKEAHYWLDPLKQ